MQDCIDWERARTDCRPLAGEFREFCTGIEVIVRLEGLLAHLLADDVPWICSSEIAFKVPMNRREIQPYQPKKVDRSKYNQKSSATPNRNGNRNLRLNQSTDKKDAPEKTGINAGERPRQENARMQGLFRRLEFAGMRHWCRCLMSCAGTRR